MKNRQEFIKYARSYLFTPAINADKFSKGVQLGAEVNVLDLEDSVSLPDKLKARLNLAEFFSTPKSFCTAIRINSPRTLEGLDDLKFLSKLEFLPDIIFVPKVSYPEELSIVRELLQHNPAIQPAVMGIIESAEAIINLVSITKMSDGIIFGSLDFSVACDIEPTWESLLTARTRMIMAAANAGVTCIDTAYFDVSDKVGLENECTKLRQLGFRAKAAIHVSQIETINRIFTPNEAEIENATNVLKAYEKGEGGIKVLDTKMIGPPFVLQAKKILKRANFHNNKTYDSIA